MAARALIVASALAVAAAGLDLPPFYTRTVDFPRRLKEATAKCGSLASIDTTTGLTVVNINTAASAQKGHVPVRGIILFGEHARELVSPELGLKLIADICDAAVVAHTNAQGPARFASVYTEGGVSASAYHAALADLVVSRSFSLKILPLVNPWGRKDVEAGHGCRRTNSHDVDLNRNYDAHWKGVTLAADGSIPPQLTDSYPGPSPFSEQETSIVRSVMDEFRPHFFLSVHSGTVGMYTPPAYTKHAHAADSEDGKRERLMAAMLARVLSQEGVGASSSVLESTAQAARFQGGLADISFTSSRQQHAQQASSAASSGSANDALVLRVPVGPAGREVGYECPGTCLDYAYENVHAPYSFAFEIYQQPDNKVLGAFRQKGLDHDSEEDGHVNAHGHAHSHAHGVALTQPHAQAKAHSTASSSSSSVASAPASASALNVDPLERQLQESRRIISSLPRFRALRASIASADDEQEEGGTVASVSADEDLYPVALGSCFGGRRSIIMPEHEERERLERIERDGSGLGMGMGTVLLQTQANSERTPRLSRAAAGQGQAAAQHATQQSTLTAQAGAASTSKGKHSADAQLHHVEAAAGGAATMMTGEQCFAFFNPVTQPEFDATLHKWALRTTRLMQLVHEQVMADHGMAPQ